MLNRIWASLIILAAVAGIMQTFFKGAATINAMAEGMFESAKTAVDLSIGLIAALVLWLGVFEVAAAAGIVTLLARCMAPVLRR
jgi:spore maturation protein A